MSLSCKIENGVATIKLNFFCTECGSKLAIDYHNGNGIFVHPCVDCVNEDLILNIAKKLREERKEYVDHQPV